MTTPATPQKPETPLQKEMRFFGEQLKRLGNCFINKTFDLTVNGSKRRNRMLVVLFIGIGFFATLSVHPLADWRVELGSLFQSLFNLDQAKFE